MATDTELTTRATILFPPELYGRLESLAEQRHASVDELVAEACRNQYPFAAATKAERLALVMSLATLNLPVGTPEEMERESVPAVEPLP